MDNTNGIKQLLEILSSEKFIAPEVFRLITSQKFTEDELILIHRAFFKDENIELPMFYTDAFQYLVSYYMDKRATPEFMQEFSAFSDKASVDKEVIRTYIFVAQDVDERQNRTAEINRKHWLKINYIAKSADTFLSSVDKNKLDSEVKQSLDRITRYFMNKNNLKIDIRRYLAQLPLIDNLDIVINTISLKLDQTPDDINKPVINTEKAISSIKQFISSSLICGECDNIPRSQCSACETKLCSRNCFQRHKCL